MSEDCVFCQIVDGEIPADVVYEDDEVVAFLDGNPLTEGHTLVVPREHVARVIDIPTDVAGPYFEPVPAIADAVEQAVDADGATMAWNDGAAAGQEVRHAHLHIIPRWSGDGYGPIHGLFGGSTDDADTAITAKAIRDQVNGRG
jgi:histidine triad (HIT) family protein